MLRHLAAVLRACSLLGIAAALLGPHARAQQAPPTAPGRLPIAAIREPLQEDLETLRIRTGQPANPARQRLYACRRIRSWLEIPAPAWLEAAEFFDPDEPHWPAAWQPPITQRQRASMWLLLAELCEARVTDEEREHLASGARRLTPQASRCYAHVMQCGDSGHLLLLEKITRSETSLAIALMWPLGMWSQAPGLTCPLAKVPEAHALLAELAKSEQPGIRLPALQMLDQAMPFGAGDAELAEWVVPLAREHLRATDSTLAFQESNGSMMQPYTAAVLGGLIVSIASQLKPTTTAHRDLVRQLLARSEPYLQKPQFQDPTSDFAWKLATQIAPALSAADRTRIEAIVTAHASPTASWHANRLIRRAVAALRLEPLPPEDWPDTTPTRWTDHVTRTTQHPMTVAASLRALEQSDRRQQRSQLELLLVSRSLHPGHQARAMRIAASMSHWSILLEREVLHRTSSRDPEVRLAAYEALRSRDPQTWACAWLIHEMAFDPSAELRKLYSRWTK